MTESTKGTPLEPCPFCGARTQMVIEHEVFCGSCGGRGPTIDGTLSTAESRWNTRATHDTLLADLRAATERFEADHETLVKVVGERNTLLAERDRYLSALRDIREAAKVRDAFNETIALVTIEGILATALKEGE